MQISHISICGCCTFVSLLSVIVEYDRSGESVKKLNITYGTRVSISSSIFLLMTNSFFLFLLSLNIRHMSYRDAHNLPEEK